MSNKLIRKKRRQDILPLVLQPGAVWRFFTDRQTGWGTRLMFLLAVGYVLLPEPTDAIPFIGWLDEVGVATIAIAWLQRALQRHRDRAESTEAPYPPSAQAEDARSSPPSGSSPPNA